MVVTSFLPPPLVLRWADGHHYAGLVVTIAPMSIGVYQLPIMSSSVPEAIRTGNTDQVVELAQELAAALVEWNLPYETTVEGVLILDPIMLHEIVRQWYVQTFKVSDFLGAPSSAGELPVEESIPMEVSSPRPTTP